MTDRALFLKFMGQTSENPLLLKISHADGVYLFDDDGRRYLDLISGISVSYIGHRHPAVRKAIIEQTERHTHVMVYGEFIQAAQLTYAQKLAELLPAGLESVYFVNSGSEAVEGALKLAKRFTGREEIIYFDKAYHGSTQGALSVMGNEDLKRKFRPLLPGTVMLNFGEESGLDAISDRTAAVIIEPVQGEAGVRAAGDDYLRLLRRKCSGMGALLIFDEAQSAFGRTGKFLACGHSGVYPDILVLAKALGGGMPLGAFISSGKIMSSLRSAPAFGHITTFGGHPVSAAAGLAALNVLLDDRLMQGVPAREQLLREKLRHPGIREVRSAGLLAAVQLEDPGSVERVVQHCISRGVLVDWFLFAPDCIRIAPPLIISEDQLEEGAAAILSGLG